MTRQFSHLAKKKKSDIQAISIAWKFGVSLNNTQIRALLAGLSIVYNEAFIWSFQSNVVIWVVGSDAPLLSLPFARFERSISNYKTYKGSEATLLFSKILNGHVFSNVPSVEKLYLLEAARDLAIESESLGNTLTPIIDTGLSRLSCMPEITGLTNGWLNACNSDFHFAIEFPNMFYRYSLN